MSARTKQTERKEAAKMNPRRNEGVPAVRRDEEQSIVDELASGLVDDEPATQEEKKSDEVCSLFVILAHNILFIYCFVLFCFF